MKSNKIVSLSVIALLALAPFSQAGKIGPLTDQASPSHSSGFGGWNLGNVKVDITDLEYDETGYADSFVESTGYYDAMTYGDSFESDIFDTTVGNTGNILVNLHGKDWPVGEPSGIKVIEGNTFDQVMSHSKPASCIMTTSYLEGAYLDAATPSETLCSSPFQSHKRFKLNFLNSMYTGDDAYGIGVNLTFNVDDDANAWRYMILQKINNYTDKRLDGFKIEVGFLDGNGDFTTASANGVNDLNLSIGTGEDGGNDIWASDELATFSHGLFGDIDSHFTTTGFFSPTAAGYNVVLGANEDNITSTTTLGTDYAALPVYTNAGDPTPLPLAGQFGNWLPSIWAPKGIFWDDDNDPTTDAQLVAFWAGYGDGSGHAWMKGDRDNFAPATTLELADWASSPVHAVGVIEDVLNLGLNYIVEVGDVTGFPGYVDNPAGPDATFTIRITPHFAPTAEQVAPTYVANGPTPLSNYVTEAGTISITPAPTFVVGNTLTLVVSDKGLDTTGAADTVDVNVTTSLGEYELITLTEIGLTRGVFTAELPTVAGAVADANNTGSINVTAGTVVTTNYEDLDIDGLGGGTTVVTATTTAAATPVVVPSSGDGGSSFAVNDKVSLLFTIFGFLVIGGLIARRKLA